MTCLYPHNTGQTAYWKGCRCDRCRGAKSEAERKRIRPPSPCRRCGTTDKARGGWYCEACSPLVLVDRVSVKLTISADGCWIYTGAKNRGGYGVLNGHRGRHGGVAHRIIYEHFSGPVPDGLELDHLCRVPACCNPDHLEAVTPSENVRRYRALATHCPNGHPYGDVPPGERKCPTCRKASSRERQRRYAERVREAA